VESGQLERRYVLPLAAPSAVDGPWRYARTVSPRRRAGLLLIAGGALFLVGVGVLLVGPRPSAAVGWYAYAPLSDTALPPGVLFVDPTQWWAVVVGIVGLVAAGWAAGFLAGRRAK
jgi:heme/copper-type cytochrome/quinol oxidase subunit 1